MKFITNNLADFPESGAIFNPRLGTRRLLYAGNHNIYYIVGGEVAYVLFIIDGRGILNDELREAGNASIDEIIT